MFEKNIKVNNKVKGYVELIGTEDGEEIFNITEV
jgi:hypothetical protein